MNKQRPKRTLNYDPHWYRRIWHTFAAVFLYFYLLPNVYWINLAKYSVGIGLLIFILVLEVLRIKGKIGSSLFFGLKLRERYRICSYVFWSIGLLLLLLFFPQPIAIPCILGACFADPTIGELRYRYGQKLAKLVGFLLCLSFFAIGWSKAPLWAAITIPLVGSGVAIGIEGRKEWWLDDDLFMQILPACCILAICFMVAQFGIDILPGPIIPEYPLPAWLGG
jgi:dolichol kinase